MQQKSRNSLEYLADSDGEQPSIEPNLTRAGDLISEAAKSSDFVFLPENFAALAGDDPLISGLGEAGGTGQSLFSRTLRSG